MKRQIDKVFTYRYSGNKNDKYKLQQQDSEMLYLDKHLKEFFIEILNNPYDWTFMALKEITEKHKWEIKYSK